MGGCLHIHRVAQTRACANANSTLGCASSVQRALLWLCFLEPPRRRNQLLSANKHEFQIIAKYLDCKFIGYVIASDDWQRVLFV